MGRKTPNRKNLPNLRQSDGTIQNKHGVQFTQQDWDDLKKLVRRSKYNRNKIMKEVQDLPRTYGGAPIGGAVRDLDLMGAENDFYIAKKSASLHQFETRKQFETYMKNLKRVNNKNYLKERTRLYKRNYIESLQEIYGKETTKKIANKLRNMKTEDYYKLVMSEEMAKIEWLYPTSPEEYDHKLNQIVEDLDYAISKIKRGG